MSAAPSNDNVRPLAGKVTHSVVPVTPEIAKRWLARNKKNRKIRQAVMRREGKKMPDRDYLALFITAWNAWREGREMSKFQRPRGGSYSEETFPEPR